jgi:DNA-binding HxlR family transcriptional regulator
MIGPRVKATLEHCSLPAALEMMGERWSFLILRAALSKVEHFEEFQSTLGIARNILSNRLGRLVDNGILSRAPDPADKRRVRYCLTEKGEELIPAMLALRQWGQKWGMGGGDAPVPVLVDARDRKPVRPIVVQASDGRTLRRDDMRWAWPDEIAGGEDH